MNKGFLHIILFLLLSGSLPGQNDITHQIDSLETVLKKAGTDAERMRLFMKLAQQYQYVDNEKALSYTRKAQSLAEAGNDQKTLADVYFMYGYIDYSKGNFEKALASYIRSETIFIALGDKEGIARLKYHSGVVHVFMGNYPKANSNFFEALKAYEEIGEKGLATNCLIAIGNVYGRQNNKVKELEYHTKALKAKQEEKDEYGIAACYVNIGNIYSEEKRFDEALDQYFKALEIAERLNIKKWIVNAIGNIGMVYANTGDYKKSQEYSFRSLKISRQMEDKQAITTDLFTIGNNYLNMGDFEKAKDYLRQSIDLAHEIGSIVDEESGYESLSTLYSKAGDYREAFHAHVSYTKLKDSIFKQENAKQFAEMGAKYETEKKDSEIRLLNKDKEAQAAHYEQQRIIIWCVAGGLFIVILLAFFIFSMYRTKKKTNSKLETAYHVLEEKNKDITDSINYARRIQSAMLPSLPSMQEHLPSLFVLYKPKDIVSGDFYWFSERKGDLFIAAADCTGHGVPGAFMSMIGNDLLNHLVIEQDINAPGEVLSKLHDGVRNALKQTSSQNESRDGMDIVLLRIRKTAEGGMLSYAGALRPLWLIKKGSGSVTEYKPDKYSIGGAYSSDKRTFTEHAISLEKGDRIYITTDGFADQFGGPNGKKFMTRNMKELLVSTATLSISSQGQELEAALGRWKSGREQVDDILVIGIEI